MIIRKLAIVVVVVIATGCAGNGSSAAPSAAAAASAAATAATVSAAPSTDPWLADLAFLDTQVRAIHPNPFAIHPESEWTAKLADLKTLATATPDQQIAGIASLVGLLDTHTAIVPDNLKSYDVLLYPFADGWYVNLASDPSLVGSRVVSIGGHPIADVEAAMRPLVAADNESGELDGLQAITCVEYLHGLGIVDDPARPAFVFAKPDGTQVTVDLESTVVWQWANDLLIRGGLNGTAPESVARRGTPVWNRLDKPTKTFVLSYNDYTENDLPPALTAMKAALDDGSATRVLLDMRYIRGGNGSLADPLIAALRDDPRINRPGGLVVMTGRENVSAGTIVARALDTQTKATFVGEMTPARADGFLCECQDITLPHSGLIVSLPTVTFNNGDTRKAIEPDIPFALTGKDFFAGKDPALAVALAVKDPPTP